MTSIRKAKKWYKSCINSKNEYEKKLGTIRKCPAFHRYIMRHRPKGSFVHSQYGQSQEESGASTRRLLCKKVYKVERLWCYSRYYTANITGLLYVETRKFLWWELSPILYIEVKVPYIDEPFYDGEYDTNNRLSSLEVQMRAEMEVVKDKFQRRLDRLIKRKSRA